MTKLNVKGPTSPPTPATLDGACSGNSRDWTSIYLTALGNNCGQKTPAALAAGVHLTTVQRRRKVDLSFAQEEAEAMAISMDSAESEARRRAVEGCKRRWYDKEGRVIREEIEYSDTILLRLLERLETGQWRQKQTIEHQGGITTHATRVDRKAALELARKEMEEERLGRAGRSL